MYKITTILSLVILFGCRTSFDCSQFRNGKFLIHNPDHTRDLIERKDSLQIEKDLNTGFIANVKIIWISPCEYDILELKTNLGTETATDSFFKTNVIHVKIIAIGKNYYVYSSTVDKFEGKEISDTARVFKDKKIDSFGTDSNFTIIKEK